MTANLFRGDQPVADLDDIVRNALAERANCFGMIGKLFAVESERNGIGHGCDHPFAHAQRAAFATESGRMVAAQLWLGAGMLANGADPLASAGVETPARATGAEICAGQACRQDLRLWLLTPADNCRDSAHQSQSSRGDWGRFARA